MSAFEDELKKITHWHPTSPLGKIARKVWDAAIKHDKAVKPSPNNSEPVGEASTQINQPCGIKQPCANVGIECDSCSHNGGLSSVNFFEAD